VSIDKCVCLCFIHVSQVCAVCRDIYCFVCACVCMCECMQELITQQPDLLHNWFYFILFHFILFYFILFYLFLFLSYFVRVCVTCSATGFHEPL